VKAPSPAFSFYPKDILSDERCVSMTHEEFGAYIRLLCHAWLEGSIPSDPVRIGRVLGVGGRAFRKLWPSLAPCFETVGDRLVQCRLERERERQVQRSTAQAERGRKGGRPTGSTKEKSHGLNPEKPRVSRTKAGKSLPSPFPSPYVPFPALPTSEATGTGESPPAVAAPSGKTPVAEPDINGALKQAPLTPEIVTGNGAWPRDWSKRVVDITREHGEAPPGPILHALKPMEFRWKWEDVERGFRAYVEAGKLEFGAGPFVRSARQWIEEGGPPSPQRMREKRSDEALKRFMEGASQ
jgi:uncharacterized protein YdaU (DUF1376 family)